MKKRIKGRVLSRTTDQRKHLFRGLIRSIADKGYVVTTITKAKAFRPVLEKLVTRAKKQSLVNYRIILAKTGDIEVTKNLMQAGHHFASRPGGYTRIIRVGFKKGDNTQLVRLEWVEKLKKPAAKVEAEKKAKKQTTDVKIERKNKKS